MHDLRIDEAVCTKFFNLQSWFLNFNSGKSKTFFKKVNYYNIFLPRVLTSFPGHGQLAKHWLLSTLEILDIK